MTFKEWIAATTLVLLIPNVADAATEANFDAKTTADLVALCSAMPDNGMGTAALNFCQGYIQGAVTVEMLNMAAFRGPKPFCLPNPPPTRSQAISAFVNWAQATPDRMTQSATDGLFRFIGEQYRCPPSK